MKYSQKCFFENGNQSRRIRFACSDRSVDCPAVPLSLQFGEQDSSPIRSKIDSPVNSGVSCDDLSDPSVLMLIVIDSCPDYALVIRPKRAADDLHIPPDIGLHWTQSCLAYRSLRYFCRIVDKIRIVNKMKKNGAHRKTGDSGNGYFDQRFQYAP